MSNSPNGFPPYTWGPQLWSALNMIALNYPVSPTKQEKEDFFMFFKSLGAVLPCPACSENYRDHAAHLDKNRHLKSRFTLLRWVFEVHNAVNSSKSPPSKTLNTSEMMKIVQRYEALRSGPKESKVRALVLFVPKVLAKARSSILFDTKLDSMLA